MVMAEKGEHSEAKEVLLPKPKLSMSDLVFVVHLSTAESNIMLMVRHVDREFGSNDRFHIEVPNLRGFGMSEAGMDDVMIRLEVVYKGDLENCVIIMGAIRSLDTNFGWLIDDFVAPKDLLIRGLAADVKVGFNGDLLDMISLEIFTKSDQKYFTADDTLRYLECFFP